VVGRRQASGPRWGRDRIPKDADGRLRVFRRLAVLFYWLSVIEMAAGPTIGAS
jgi:hypothetical protein